MYWEIRDINDKVITTSYDSIEVDDMMENEFKGLNYYVVRVIPCRCGAPANERHDAYGISTGYWCDDCYNSDRYPYRRDRYPTIETHGYGERLEDDY